MNVATSRVTLAAIVLILGISAAEAGPIVWQWAGTVNGYSLDCAPGSHCGATIDSVVPLGTPIEVVVSMDLDLQLPNPQVPCYRGTATTSMHVLGRTYGGVGHVWDEGQGFGPGTCSPGYDVIEIVAPAWGQDGPALPDGWVPYVDFDFYFPGLWWGGDLTAGQPDSISSQFPRFYLPGQSFPQRFTANLQALPAGAVSTPEPTTWLLFSTGLGVTAWRRRRSSMR